MENTRTAWVLPLREIGPSLSALVGGKNAALGVLVRELGGAGIRVPDGFVLTTDAFREHLRGASVGERELDELDRLDARDVGTLARVAGALRERIAAAPLPAAVSRAALAAYRELCRNVNGACDVAVRSSATAEDLPEASFAGPQETYLNVRGEAELDSAVRRCMASLYTDRAIVYRAERGIRTRDVALSVCVQRMVRSDQACAGVIFTLDPESGFRGVVLVTGSWGLGELVVQGRVAPDEFWVHKATLASGHASIVRRELGTKELRLEYGERGTRAVREVRTSSEQRERFVLEDAEVLQLARWSLAIEEHWSRAAGRALPMDIEWAKDGVSGELYIVQARPETVHARKAAPKLELFRLRGRTSVLARGQSVGNRVGVGRVRIVHAASELSNFQDGDVLVAQSTDPDWEPVLARAAAVVTDQGGRTCHAAIVSRELGLPCVVGTGDATRALRAGDEVTVSCAEGAEGRVYAGRVPFTREEIDLAALPVPRVPLMLNVADPDRAWQLAQLPSAGVGLLRIEFLISSWIGVHPLALLHPERVATDAERAEIARRCARWSSPAEFFVERLASGIAVIAAAFHPRPVIVRFSDFKSNEYAGLLGGSAFEPHEENPMIGFRGASRYYDERYREGFALECRAVRRVREELGLGNVRVMIPFCRTLGEGRSVLAELASNGLVRGERGLEVWVMCEIPNNVVLAEDFCELFDGFSIGSNDLTQLTLGIDRDSPLLARLFDERDPGVKKLIESVVAAAHRKGRRVGLCGQAPSDHPDFAEFLASIGIDSISLSPDSLPEVARRLASPSR